MEGKYHYIGVCTALSEFREKWLGNAGLSTQECINYMTDQDWQALNNYHLRPWKYSKKHKNKTLKVKKKIYLVRY